MELIAIIVLAALLPIMSISSFLIGYNVNATKKVFVPKKKETHEKTQDEIMLERIDNARV
jgi:type IV secretory pathway component VirB8